MDKDKLFALAKEIVENGKMCSHSVFCEGNVESGPYSVEHKFIKYNGLILRYVHTSGALVLESKKIDKYGVYPAVYRVIYQKYITKDEETIQWAKKVQRYFWYNNKEELV